MHSMIWDFNGTIVVQKYEPMTADAYSTFKIADGKIKDIPDTVQ